MMLVSVDPPMARLHVTSSLFIVGALLSAVLTHGAELNTNQPRLRGLTEQVRDLGRSSGPRDPASGHQLQIKDMSLPPHSLQPNCAVLTEIAYGFLLMYM